jgi:hypothetical protein
VLLMLVLQHLLSMLDVIINTRLSPSSVLDPISLAHIAMLLLEVSLKSSLAHWQNH